MGISWKELLYDEIHFKESGNINKLLEISYEFFEKHSGVGNCIYWLLKISYYTGRAKDNNAFEKYIQFTKDKNEMLSFIINAEEVKLGQNLLKIGFDYPILSDEQYNLVNNLYQGDKYQDLLDDIFFDEYNLPIKFKKKSSVAPSKVRNSEFSQNLINKLFDGFLNNYNLKDNQSEFYYYYNRALNDVEKIRTIDIAKWVHFYIDFNITNRIFANRVKKIIGLDFYEKLLEKMNIEKKENDLTYEITFDDYSWSTFTSFIEKKIENIEEIRDLKNLIIKAIVIEWLEELNQVN
jgi:hypothetical protein